MPILVESFDKEGNMDICKVITGCVLSILRGHPDRAFTWNELFDPTYQQLLSTDNMPEVGKITLWRLTPLEGRWLDFTFTDVLDRLVRSKDVMVYHVVDNNKGREGCVTLYGIQNKPAESKKEA